MEKYNSRRFLPHLPGRESWRNTGGRNTRPRPKTVATAARRNQLPPVYRQETSSSKMSSPVSIPIYRLNLRRFRFEGRGSCRRKTGRKKKLRPNKTAHAARGNQVPPV